MQNAVTFNIAAATAIATASALVLMLPLLLRLLNGRHAYCITFVLFDPWFPSCFCLSVVHMEWHWAVS